MALHNLSVNRFAASGHESADPFAMQLALSQVHARLVPMRRVNQRYEVDPSTEGWFELPAGRGFAGYGLGRALRMLLDVLRGLTALHDTFDAAGETFVHGEVALPQFRVDMDGVCRLIPLTERHSGHDEPLLGAETLGHMAPERLLGEKVDPRADVFSAGVLLWEALAGRRLFEESTGDAIIDRLMGEKLQMPQLPPELAWAIPLKSVAARALSVDPYQRFADCAELATAIAIVSRDRVASHTEIATFFGAPPRSPERRTREGSSVTPTPSQRPVPSQSSTFAAVDVPASSRRTSTLAPLGPARSLTPAPVSLRSPTVAAVRPVAHKSPFSALISAESRAAANSESGPLSLRSHTLTTLGTPDAVVAPVDAAPAAEDAAPESQGAPRSSRRPPPLPAWAQVPSFPPPASTKSTFTAVMSPLAAPVAEPSAPEEVEFRSWPVRRVLSVVAVLSVGAVLALVALTRNNEATASNAAAAPVAAAPTLARATAAAAPAHVDSAAPVQPAPVTSASAAPMGTLLPNAKGPHVAPLRAAAKGARAAAKDKDKDYGI